MAGIETNLKNRAFYEYQFAATIADLNQTRSLYDLSPVMVSQAKSLREAVIDKCIEKSDSAEMAAKTDIFYGVTPKNFRESVKEVLQEYYPEGTSYQDSQYQTYGQEFMNVTGFSSRTLRPSGRRGSELMVPVSPYDDRFSGRSDVMKAGSRILYVNMDTFGNMLEDIHTKGTLYEKRRDRFVEAGDLYSPSDASGMSRLMPFIPEKDYQMLADWVNTADSSQYMSSEMVDRSVAILSYLRDTGRSFSIERDRYPGQLCAVVGGYGVHIRVADVKQNEMYVGSVYDSGRRIYFSTTPRSHAMEAAPVVITPEDSVNLVKFVLGESVDRKDVKQKVGTYGIYASGKYSRSNTYYTDRSGFSAIYKGIPNPNGRMSFDKVTIHSEDYRVNQSMNFTNENVAEAFLMESVSNARNVFNDAIGVDRLIQEASEHADDSDYLPDFSGDDSISAIQSAYWDVLSGRKSDLMKLGEKISDYDNIVETLDAADLSDTSIGALLTKDMFYEGTPEEKVRQHLLDLTNEQIGQFAPDEEGKRFDPGMVSRYMNVGNSTYRNMDHLAKAMSKAGIRPEELKGSDADRSSISNRMLQFDPSKAKPMAVSANPFVRSMYDTIYHTLQESGVNVSSNDILMDENGVVHYKGIRSAGWKVDNGNKTEEIEGQIGQIFVPDDLGMVETKFAGGDNYIFVPGYQAYILPQKPGENLSMEERTRLHGYEQEMKETLAYQIRQDVTAKQPYGGFGTATSVNGVHHRLYDTRFPLDVVKRSLYTDGMRRDVFEATIKTLSQRVRYENEYRDGSTINADYQAKRRQDLSDQANDNYYDPYFMTGNRNLSVMSEGSFGYFDPSATSTSINQGIVRFLTDSAKVSPDGRIIPGDKDDKTALMKIPEMRYAEHSPFDRNQMVFSNLLTARSIANDVHMCQMTFGGWNFDDGYIVSKEFAEKHPIRDTEGNLRPLIKGDKICDFGGNKGVISLIVDRNLSVDHIRQNLLLHADDAGNYVSATYDGKEFKLEDPKDRFRFYEGMPYEDCVLEASDFIFEELDGPKMQSAIDWFQANPELDVVGAPFPAVSRFNGSSDKILMEHPEDLRAPDGTVYEGCMGTTSFIITDMPVDEKTHDYGQDGVAEGKGRRASSQLAWAFASQDCTHVMDELYGSNSGTTANLREYLITIGLDMDETGTLRTEYAPHPGEERRVFEMPKLEYVNSSHGPRVNMQKMRQDFLQQIGDAGGVMEVPFRLTYPTGNPIPPMNDKKTDVVYKKEEWERKGYTRKDGVYVRPTTVRRKLDSSERSVSRDTYGLPVLSSYLRSSQEFDDDNMVVYHDYTRQYEQIFESSIQYRVEAASEHPDEKKLNNYQSTAQRAYNQIALDIQERQFNNQKRNIFKNGIMNNRLKNSATAVWTADPTLDVDQLAMPSSMASSLGVKENGYILNWRDPILRDGGLRYSRVKIDDTLTGVAINPAMDKSYEGDFDGDSIGLAKLNTAAAHREAMEKLTWEANILDLGAVKELPDGSMGHPLMAQDGLDLASAKFARPELKEVREAIEMRANHLYQRFLSEGNTKEVLQGRKQLIQDFSDHIQDAFSHEFGTDMISYKDDKSHLKSIEHVVQDGAKGNYKKLKDYMKYMGWSADMEMDENGKPCGIKYDTFEDHGHSLATYQDAKDTMYATAVKSFGTGVAGKFSQRGMSAMWNVCPRAVLELTYPNTQGVLQAKHDPIDAAHRYEMLMTAGRELWRGYKLERNADTDGMVHWNTVRGSDGKALQATPEEWKMQFQDVYGPDGFDIPVNPAYIDEVAKALTDPNTNTIKNMEKDEMPESAILTQLAYGGGMPVLQRAAIDRKNLFEGKYTSHFAPVSIRKNKEAVLLGAETKAIQKQDTKSDFVPRKKEVEKPAAAVNNRFRYYDVKESANVTVSDSHMECDSPDIG